MEFLWSPLGLDRVSIFVNFESFLIKTKISSSNTRNYPRSLLQEFMALEQHLWKRRLVRRPSFLHDFDSRSHYRRFNYDSHWNPRLVGNQKLPSNHWSHHNRSHIPSVIHGIPSTRSRQSKPPTLQLGPLGCRKPHSHLCNRLNFFRNKVGEVRTTSEHYGFVVGWFCDLSCVRAFVVHFDPLHEWEEKRASYLNADEWTSSIENSYFGEHQAGVIGELYKMLLKSFWICFSIKKTLKSF